MKKLRQSLGLAVNLGGLALLGQQLGLLVR